jgi:membrane-bound lytic murein transglycosylase D
MQNGRIIITILLMLSLTACAGLRAPFSPPPDAAPPSSIIIFDPLPEMETEASRNAELRAEPVEPDTADLWDRIRDGLRLQDLVTHDRVSQKLDQFLTPSAALLQIDRSRYYLAFVVAEVEARGLPQELALLPFIESSLDPYAFSQGGASGLWQLMPSTARHHGVEMNWWYDGRRDVVESTNAALDYLEQLHAQFDDWLLAIAAYNAGQGRIRRALRDAGTGATYWDLRVPAETARFVPRLLALSALVAAPEDFDVSLPALEPDVAFVSTELQGQVDLTDLAERAAIPVPEIFLLNPGLNHGATPPQVPHRLLIPAGYVEQFDAALAAQPQETARWVHHDVRRGETLSGIAARTGTSVAAIRDANNLNGHLIREGQRLVIPHPTIASGQVPPNPLLQARSAASTRYRVRAGDSLWSISRRFNTSVNQLVRLNRLNPGAPLQIGQQLAVPGTAPGESERALRRVHYRVRSGDSLSAIAARFNVTVRQIVNWNALDRNAYLQPGQRLLIMVDIRSTWS